MIEEGTALTAAQEQQEEGRGLFHKRASDNSNSTNTNVNSLKLAC